jgi:hypothetical protein
MMDKNKHYRMIEICLKAIAGSRKMLVEVEGEEKSKVDEFISDFGAKEFDRLDKITPVEFIMEMVKEIMDETNHIAELRKGNE